jgi:hypothetical protein
MKEMLSSKIIDELISLGIAPNVEIKIDWLRDLGKPVEQYYQRLYITINETVIQRVIFLNDVDKWIDAEVTQIINTYTGYDKMQKTLPFGVYDFKPLPQYKDKEVIRVVETLKETPKWRLLKRLKIMNSLGVK